MANRFFCRLIPAHRAALQCIDIAFLIIGIGIGYLVGKAVEKFRKTLSESPEVSQCYYVTGTYDLVVIVNTRDMKSYEAFSKKHFMDNENVKSFYTHVVLDKLKMSYSVEI